jgi:hypothetical protein
MMLLDDVFSLSSLLKIGLLLFVVFFLELRVLRPTPSRGLFSVCSRPLHFFYLCAHGAMIRTPTFSGSNSRCSDSHCWKKTSAKQKLHDQNRFQSRVLLLPRCARTFTTSREEENSSPWWFPQKSPKPKSTGRERVIVASSIFPSSTSEGRESNDADDNALILYTKPGCCLCEGLEEKLKAVLELAHKSQQRETTTTTTTTTTGNVVNSNSKKSRNTHIALDLREYALEIRDVSLKKEWADAHAGEIPVLFVGKRGDADDAQTASKVKRPTPRVSVERLKLDLEKHLASLAASTSETNRDDMGGGGGGGGGGWTVISAKPF